MVVLHSVVEINIHVQTIKAYFDRNVIRAQFLSDSFTSVNEEEFMYSIPLTIYTGVNNLIRVSCLNPDQKNIDVSNLSIQFGLFVPETENELLTANAIPIDSANGVVQVTLIPAELAPLDVGFYECTLTAADANSVSYPVYVNDSYQTRLMVNLEKGPIDAYGNPIFVSWSDIPDVGVTSSQIDLTSRPVGSSLATLQTNLVDYTGNIISQGALNTTPLPHDWGNISFTNFSNFSGNTFINVEGIYASIRFVADGIDPQGTGNVTTANIALVVNQSSIRI
ncbi:Uncharacterised protein [uncultured archaeon]|nr:Uncharacterised protein [uncultured archaeon]